MADFSRRIIRGTVEFSPAEIIRHKTGSWCGLQLLLPDKVIHCPSACCGRKLDKLRPQYCRDVASHRHLHRTDSQGRNDPLATEEVRYQRLEKLRLGLTFGDA
jgi:hypothetical protein